MEQDVRNIDAQVRSLPELIRGQFEALDERARRLLSRDGCRSTRRIVVAGCGDSHMAGLAAELAFEELAGIPTEPMTAMQAARYTAPQLEQSSAPDTLVVGISVSGTVARTREAIALSRKAGALTVAVSADAGSPLARAADVTFDCRVPDFAPAPGIRSYRVSLLALYLLATHLGEANGRLTPDQADQVRRRLAGTADAIEATIAEIAEPARELASAVAAKTNFVFVGDGPNYATALFSAAKVIEAAGRHAQGQDTEEWAHLQYFVHVDPATPTFVISPGGRGHGRAEELVDLMRQVGRTVVAVVPDGDRTIAPGADWVLPVVGAVPELFSPMVYAVAGELFSGFLAQALGERPFRDFSGAYEPGAITIRTSAVVDDLPAYG